MKKFKNSGQFKPLELENKRFFSLTVLGKAASRHNASYWKCKCDCGNECEVIGTRLVQGKTKSCGCYRKRKHQNETHGLRHHKLYGIWKNMRGRCNTPTYQNYYLYGGRGIRVCEEWDKSFVSFFNDMNPTYSYGMHLDRINNNGNYEPNNCRWATPLQNNRNKRTNVYITLDGRTHVPAQWASELNIKADTICSRKRKGWSDYECLFGKIKHV